MNKINFKNLIVFVSFITLSTPLFAQTQDALAWDENLIQEISLEHLKIVTTHYESNPKTAELSSIKKAIREIAQKVVRTKYFIDLVKDSTFKDYPEVVILDTIIRITHWIVVYPLCMKLGYAHLLPYIQTGLSPELLDISYIAFMNWYKFRKFKQKTGYSKSDLDKLKQKIFGSSEIHDLILEVKPEEVINLVIPMENTKFSSLLKLIKPQDQKAPSAIPTKDLEKIINNKDFIYYAQKIGHNEFTYHEILIQYILADSSLRETFLKLKPMIQFNTLTVMQKLVLKQDLLKQELESLLKTEQIGYHFSQLFNPAYKILRSNYSQAVKKTSTLRFQLIQLQMSTLAAIADNQSEVNPSVLEKMSKLEGDIKKTQEGLIFHADKLNDKFPSENLFMFHSCRRLFY